MQASAASAQVTTATIVGTITDSSGAALPGASVTARNVDTGFNRTVPSNEDGAYRLEFPPIGRDVVEVGLSGFKTATRSGIVLSVNDTARVDAALSIGGVAETVNVEGASPDVNTTTSEISKTIDAVAIQSLPIVDRNVYSLLDLTPGVQSEGGGVEPLRSTATRPGICSMAPASGWSISRFRARSSCIVSAASWGPDRRGGGVDGQVVCFG